MLAIETIGVLVIVLLTPYAMGFNEVISESNIDHNTILVRIMNNNPVEISPTTPNYTPIPSNQTVSGETYDTILISNNETEGNGIADANGEVNVEFTLDDPRPFCIVVRHIDGSNSKLKISVTIDGVKYDYTSVLSGNIIQYIGLTDKYFQLSRLKNDDNWITSTNPIQVSIHNFTGAEVPESVTLSLLFNQD